MPDTVIEGSNKPVEDKPSYAEFIPLVWDEKGQIGLGDRTEPGIENSPHLFAAYRNVSAAQALGQATIEAIVSWVEDPKFCLGVAIKQITIGNETVNEAYIQIQGPFGPSEGRIAVQHDGKPTKAFFKGPNLIERYYPPECIWVLDVRFGEAEVIRPG